MKRITVLLILIILFASVQAQNDSIPKKQNKTVEKLYKLPLLGKNTYTFNYKSLSVFYPMEELPTLGWKSKLRSDESILFDFHPILTLNFYNNFDTQMEQKKLFSMSYYFAFRPHFRMYAKNSTPVQMPSYKIFIGLKHMYRLSDKHYVGYAIESGHYSNGQPGCALTGGGEDQSAACDSMYALINSESNLSDMINRVNGDFSTNLSKLDFAYRYIAEFDAFERPKQVHSATLGFVRYHNNFLGVVDLGGFSDNAIKMYGRWRFLVSYAYSFQWESGYRIKVMEDIEVIQGAHPFVNPFRSVTSAAIYLPRNIGFFVSYIYGHDDYNLRFVDSGHQFGMGMTWDMFAPVSRN